MFEITISSDSSAGSGHTNSVSWGRCNVLMICPFFCQRRRANAPSEGGLVCGWRIAGLRHLQAVRDRWVFSSALTLTIGRLEKSLKRRELLRHPLREFRFEQSTRAENGLAELANYELVQCPQSLQQMVPR